MALKTPVVLFIYKRTDTLAHIIGSVRTVMPAKIYILADGPRNDEEKELTDKCRRVVESLIDWPCQIIKRYADRNLGVYRNIGEGARWVFSDESTAIFLEDDNLPEISFFEFCESMLDKYRKTEEVLWICGTNYLGKFRSPNSYFFTQHLLPCGWASWSDKFLEEYDGELLSINDQELWKQYYGSYSSDMFKNRALMKQQEYSILRTKYLLGTDVRRASWDFQMLFSVRGKNRFGIAPSVNQIKNIGVDALSTHGGSSFKNTMTQRFCGMPSYLMEFPLRHPDHIEVDAEFENLIGKIITYPLQTRIVKNLLRPIKHLIGMNQFDSFVEKMAEVTEKIGRKSR